MREYFKKGWNNFCAFSMHRFQYFVSREDRGEKKRRRDGKTRRRRHNIVAGIRFFAGTGSLYGATAYEGLRFIERIISFASVSTR